MPKGSDQKQRMHLMMSSGAIVVDGSARRIGSQLVSDQLRGIAVPGREIPTPSYIHRELNRAPAQYDGVHVETVTPVPVEFDSQFLNEDAEQIWDGARNDMDTESDAQRRWERRILAIALVASILIAPDRPVHVLHFAGRGSRRSTAERREAGGSHAASHGAAGADPAPGGRLIQDDHRNHGYETGPSPGAAIPRRADRRPEGAAPDRRGAGAAPGR